MKQLLTIIALIIGLAPTAACLPKAQLSPKLGCELPPIEHDGAVRVFCADDPEAKVTGCLYLETKPSGLMCVHIVEEAACSGNWEEKAVVCGVKLMLPQARPGVYTGN